MAAGTPCAQAARLTRGSFSFGVSAHEDGTTAAVFFTFGVLLVACPCAVSVFLVRRWRKSAPRGVRLSDTETEAYGTAKPILGNGLDVDDAKL